MAGFTPIWLVNKFKNVQRAASANAYTDAGDKEDLWKVGMQHGFFQGVGQNLYFESEDQANAFALWQIYNPQQILEIVGADSPFLVQSIERQRGVGKRNMYTDQMEMVESWQVAMDGVNNGMKLDLRMPSEREARAFDTGQMFKMQDLLGTLPSMTADVAASLEAFAATAQALEDKANQQKREADDAKAAFAAAQETYNENLKERARLQAIADEAERKRLAELPAPVQPKAPGTGVPTVPYVEYSTFISTTGFQSGFRWWTITNGGAHGYYIWPNGWTERVWTGGWNNPYNGQWFGFFDYDERGGTGEGYTGGADYRT